MNNERQADKCCDDEGIPTPSPGEVKEGLLLAPSQKGEPSKFDQTRDDVIVKPSDSTNFALNGQQSDTSLSPISNAQIDQMIALEGNSHSEVQTDKDFSTSQKDNKKEFPDTVPSERIDASLVDTIPQSLDVSVKEDSSLVNQETSKMVETETVILSENKSLQDQQHREIAPQVLDGNQPYTDILSDQKDTTGEQQIQPICQETNLNVDQREVQSSSVNSNKVECLVQSQPSPNQLTEVFDKETSLSSLPADKLDSEKTEISIMEATMDHNEWIIDGSYQVLPWMNLTSSRDASSSKEEVELVESKSSAQTSTTEDGAENAKKVLAVQPMPQNVNVTFRVHYLPLSPYQTVAKTKDGYWSCVVGLPAESHVEWKFVVLDKGEVCRWEECGNRLLYTGYGDDLLVHKWWGFL
uniref:CBM20 domain-containing protein n=1 Tax=Periophthalmus magnuspinnatus TaxID=409849 RepID=A0A3B3ZMI6_9GOBI